MARSKQRRDEREADAEDRAHTQLDSKHTAAVIIATAAESYKKQKLAILKSKEESVKSQERTERYAVHCHGQVLTQ